MVEVRTDKPFALQDGLYVVQQNPDIIKGYPSVVLTPNANEFKRLCEVMVGITRTIYLAIFAR